MLGIFWDGKEIRVFEGYEVIVRIVGDALGLDYIGFLKF